MGLTWAQQVLYNEGSRRLSVIKSANESQTEYTIRLVKAQAYFEAVSLLTAEALKEQAAIECGSHSRACGIRRHEHGNDCHRNCPTCAGFTPVPFS